MTDGQWALTIYLLVASACTVGGFLWCEDDEINPFPWHVAPLPVWVFVFLFITLVGISIAVVIAMLALEAWLRIKRAELHLAAWIIRSIPRDRWNGPLGRMVMLWAQSILNRNVRRWLGWPRE